MAANPQTVETPARLPKPGDVDWFLTAADRARAAKALRMTVEAPTMWRGSFDLEALQREDAPPPVPVSAPGYDARVRWRIVNGATLDATTGCWVWSGTKNEKGYGRIGAYRRNLKAHRVAYELFIGPIADGLTIDHLCRNRACVNPAHLEAVPHVVNVRRGYAGKVWSARTHCKNGHEFTPENVGMESSRPNVRICKECRRAKDMRLRTVRREYRRAA